MNIMDYMEGVGEPPPLDPESFEQLFGVRLNTFYAFMDKEHERGILFAPFDLRTPKGQDAARLLFWRTIEEYGEAIQAKTHEHVLEELIDAFNYGAAAIIATGQHPKEGLLEAISPSWVSEDPTIERMGYLVLGLSKVTDKFRNRSWMENSQSMYFDGLADYHEALCSVLRQICRCFESWDEFWKYFMAKDAVLQFRLRSNY